MHTDNSNYGPMHVCTTTCKHAYVSQAHTHVECLKVCVMDTYQVKKDCMYGCLNIHVYNWMYAHPHGNMHVIYVSINKSI